MPYRQATRRFLATVLFTDIVGSTERAQELGDRAWRDLLERHNAVVRRELKKFQGREMDTAGDGFFAVFETPERAVRCAESITTAVAALGLQVRAGVHTGECEVIGGKVGGITVTLGARIAALAGPGEVLVSRSVRDLMTGSDRRFEGGEQHTLKGVAEPMRVYRLLPDMGAGNATDAPRRSMVPLYTRRARRRLLTVVAAGTVVALAAATTYALTRSEASVVVGENAVGVIGPGAEDRILDAVGVGQRPSALAGSREVVWVTNSTSNSVSRIDRATKVTVPVPVGSSPSGIALGAGAVWVANSGDATVSRIDPATFQRSNIEVPPGPTGIVVAFGSVWVTNALDASVTEIDPDTNKVVKVVPVGAGPTGIAAGAGALWVTNQADGTVTRIDPDTYQRDPAAIAVGNGPQGIAFGSGAAWVANNLDGSLSRIDADDFSVTTRPLAKGGGAHSVAISGDQVWVSNENAGTLMQISARDDRAPRTVELRGAPLGLAFVGKDLWFTNAAGGAALHRGGVLTMVGPAVNPDDDPAVLDPTLAYDPQSFRLAQVMHDGLMGFRRSGGVQAAALVPNLASRRPTPTEDGLTYTFHLRKGVRYSTGKPVLAGDIRRGIERTVVNNYGAGYTYSGVIIGGEDCKAAADQAVAANKPLPDCDLSKGIIANDRTGTVTFRLTTPTPEFIYQLALPSASAVPQDTPTNLQPGTFLPSTGPYKIGSYTPQKAATKTSPAIHGRLALVRNPYFRQWSAAAQPAGYPDRIVLDTGYGGKEAVARVIDGRADLLWWLNPGNEVERLRARFREQLHTSGGPFLQYALLNARKPPFDNADARRAVAFALDRAAMAQAFSGRITCQLIVPDSPAYKPFCPFTVNADDSQEWTGPDVATARDLVAKSGTFGASVVVDIPDAPPIRKAAQRLVDTLKTLGYRASLRIYPTADFLDEDLTKPDRFNASISGWGADYPAASQYLVPLASGDPVRGVVNFTGRSDAGLDRQMTAALDEQARDPGGGSEAWSAIDQAVVHAAAHIPFSASVNQVLVSRRVGNVLVQPLAGPLIAQMWVQ